MTKLLEHTECPRCGASNLNSEVCCFACGARLKALPKRFGEPPTSPAPWPLWIGLAIFAAIFVLLGYQIVLWLVGSRARLGFPNWYLPVGGALLMIAGQVAFYEARQRDASSWRLRRAPELPLSQSHTGDAVWARGKVKCDTPIIPAYFPQECAYYHYIVREKEDGESGWRVTARETNAVDFELVEGEESVYVPSGCVRFDAPIYVESYLDPSGKTQIKLWAIPVGLTVALCGRIAGQTKRPRVDPLGQDLLGVVTWRTPHDYVAMITRQAHRLQYLGYLLVAGGVFILIAGLVKS